MGQVRYQIFYRAFVLFYFILFYFVYIDRSPFVELDVINLSIPAGLGLGLVLDGKLYQGSRGLIEGGHTIIDNNNQGRHCSCGQVGCVEAYSSAKSASIRMFEADIAREKDRAKMRESYSVDENKFTGKFHLFSFFQVSVLSSEHFVLRVRYLF